MIAIVDVHYAGTGGAAACVVAGSRFEAAAKEERTVWVEHVAPYEPGSFYKRELPCLLAVLALLTTPVGVIVVDGYVSLGGGAPGLGSHLFDAACPPVTGVVGVAKTSYAGAPAQHVLRGDSRAPLYVTSRGLSDRYAAQLVKEMHGPHRIPTLLRRVDQLARAVALSHVPAEGQRA